MPPPRFRLWSPSATSRYYLARLSIFPLDGFEPSGQALSFTATSNSELVSTFITKRNRSMRITAAGFGDIVFELFENRAPRVTRRIIRLAESGFYNGVIFHRVIDDFVIQGGDPTGTGAGGSTLGPFDDSVLRRFAAQPNRTPLDGENGR